MRDLNGAHGTCVTNADVIQLENRWVSTQIGRAGSGIYFWAYNEYRLHARRLAILWWEKSKSAGQYSNVKNSNCAVIYAQFSVSEGALLDCSEAPFEDALIEAIDIATEGGTKADVLTDDSIHKIYEYLVEGVELSTGCSIEVVKARVAPPKRSYVEKVALGHPSCYVVRNACKQIKISEVEKMSQ